MTDPNAIPPADSTLPPILLDWLATDDVVPSDTPTPYLPKDLDRLSAADRQAVLAWLGTPSPEHLSSPFADSAQQAAVAWLLQARTILASERLSNHEKIAKLRVTRPDAPALAVVKRLVAATLNGYGRL